MKKNVRIPITISIFAVILAVALALAASIVSYTHTNHRNSALIIADELMVRSAEILRLRAEALITPVELIANQSSTWADVDVAPDVRGHPTHDRFLSLLRELRQISTISIGFEGGSYYMMGAAHERSPEQLKRISAPEQTAYIEQVILRSHNAATQVIRHFLDEKGETISSTSNMGSKYDPRTRPWYEAAWKSELNSRTKLYLFAGTGKPGITISRRHAHGVVGIDITLNHLEEFLNNTPQADKGILAIFRYDGPVFAKATKSDAKDVALQALIERVLAQPFFQSGTLDILGEPWIAHVAKAPLGTQTDEILAVAMPVAAIAAPINRVSRNTMLVSLLIVLASVPVIWLISQRLSRPLIELAAQTERIRQFDLIEEDRAYSNIEEIFQLQKAVSRMRTSLVVFSTYVPKALVRKLINSDEVPKLGGERRNITVLFMDLENFTAMSANMEPEEVMQRMSDYFEVVTQQLLVHDATIDKYIGDAVMAFWNAPDDTPDHIAAGCRAALAVREVAAKETRSWDTTNCLPVRTSIGLHCGEVVVGNVGSSDRMNYTALGATVNLASRLEGLNRDLKTDILVSADIAEKLEDQFIFRSAGTTRLKGFEEPMEVFELLKQI